MRKVMGCLAGMALFVAGGGVAWAASYTPTTPVPIRVVDLSPQTGVTVSFSDWDFVSGNTLFYSLNSGDWTAVPNSLPGISNGAILEFGLDIGSDGGVDKVVSDALSQTFQGDVVLGSVWNTVAINWGTYGKVTIASAHSTDGVNDGFAPVPIPGSILLLGSGLAGVAVVGRRRQKTEG